MATAVALVPLSLSIGTPAASAASAVAPATNVNPVTITPNPGYTQGPFEGWGTSLVWFANATGAYPDAFKNRLYDLVFGKTGENLNIIRYNIGGGSSSDQAAQLRPGGAVPGYVAMDADGSKQLYSDANGPVTTSYADRDRLLKAWDPANDASYDWSADAGQRWWLEKLVKSGQGTRFEAFSNSAPWFMTQGGYPNGKNGSGLRENLAAGITKQYTATKFAAYLAHVTAHVQSEYGFTFNTLEALNEPGSNFWNGGGQEGMNLTPADQALVLAALPQAMADAGLTSSTVISAPDETAPNVASNSFRAYPATVQNSIGQLNTHTYGESGMTDFRDISKVRDLPEWMSEIEGNWGGSGFRPQLIDNGLGLAGKINTTMKNLEPDGWVFWQPVEDYYNMQLGEKLNWGSVFADLDCTNYADSQGNQVFKSARRVAAQGVDAAPACDAASIKVNTKYNATRNYTNFIHEGEYIVPTDSNDTTAAIDKSGQSLSAVYSNNADTPAAVTIDLSKFGVVRPGATVTPYVTTGNSDPASVTGDVAAIASTGLVPQAATPVDRSAQKVTVTVPAKSVTTFVVNGVSGVAKGQKVQDGESYLLGRGNQVVSADPATGAVTTATLGADTAALANQQFTFHQVPSPIGRPGYTLQASDGRYVVRNGSAVSLEVFASPDAAAAAPRAVWWPASTDGAYFALINSSDGSNTRWLLDNTFQIRNPRVVSAPDQSVVTAPGIVPTLPTTVTPTYSWGPEAAIPVTWDSTDLSARAKKAGSFDVHGTATDRYGNAINATVHVTVAAADRVDPTSVHVASGSTLAQVQAAVPATVTAHAADATFTTSVTWDWSTLSDASFASTGLVAVSGTALSNVPGATLPATLTVIVLAPGSVNYAAASQTGTTLAASCSHDNLAGIRDGNTSAKAMTNWSCNETQNRLTFSFNQPHTITSATVYFQADGAQTWSRVSTVQYLRPGGSPSVSTDWLNVPDASITHPSGLAAAPTDQFTFGAPVTTSGIRFVFDAFGTQYISIAEIQVFGVGGLVKSTVSTLADLRVDGVAVDGFDPAATSYTASTTSRSPVVSAVATDHAATVRISQVSDIPGSATVTVTAEDGSTQTVYTIAITGR